MNIELNLFASLSKYKPENTGKDSWIIACTEGDTVLDLLFKFHVPLKEMKIIFVNGVHADVHTVLREGDRVGVFPPAGGG
jgi:molybdopterin converting factor small subunit